MPVVLGNIINNGTITCAGDITFDGTYSGSGAHLNLSAATTTFNNSLDLSGTTLNASTGKVIIDPADASAIGSFVIVMAFLLNIPNIDASRYILNRISMAVFSGHSQEQN